MIAQITTSETGLIRLKILGQYFLLHPSKAIYWEELDSLLIADLHFGKPTHFRKAGLPVPNQVIFQNQDRLEYLLQTFQPERVFFLGDLFHSTPNEEWDLLSDIFKKYSAVSFELVIGNHDILPPIFYQSAHLKTHPEPLMIGDFCLTHHPSKKMELGQFNFCGHIHPAVRLNGLGKQRLKLPCFYFQSQQAILPAFGGFTGTAILTPNESDRVFVIAEGTVFEM